MTFSDWSVVAEIISAIGVIVSLVYLSIQVRENTKQKSSQSHQLLRSDYLASIDHCTNGIANAEIFHKGLNGFSDMSVAEQACFHSLMHPVLHGLHSIWESQKAGLVSNDDLNATRDQFVSLIMTPGGYQWWTSFRHIPPPGIVGYIDESLESSKGRLEPANENIPWLKPAN